MMVKKSAAVLAIYVAKGDRFVTAPCEFLFVQVRKRHVKYVANTLIIRHYRLFDVRGEKSDIF